MAEGISSAATYAFLGTLPDKIKGAIIAYATAYTAKKGYSVEVVLEMAGASHYPQKEVHGHAQVLLGEVF